MTHSFLSYYVSSKISILIVLTVLCGGWGDQNFVLAQINSPPDRPGITDMTGTEQETEMRIPPEYQDTSQTPYGPGQGGGGGQGGIGPDRQSPQSMEGVANQPPTLRTGLPQTGLSSAVTKDDPANLKSVREQSHPYYGFFGEFKRIPNQTGTEKEVYLYEVLNGVTSPVQRRELLRAYWELSEKMLQCFVRLAQWQRLQQAQEWMQKEQLPTDEIDLALQLVLQQYRALEMEFTQKQFRFLDLQSRIPASPTRWRTGYADQENGWGECDDMSSLIPSELVVQKAEDRPLPVPADFPLAVAYSTKVDELQKRRSLSQKSLLLTRTIPLQYEAIVARTAARSHANDQWRTVLLKNRQSPVSQIETLAHEEMSLISTIIEYNHQVDEYVIETFGANIPEKQLLASILVLPKPTTSDTGQSRTPTVLSTFQPNGNAGQ